MGRGLKLVIAVMGIPIMVVLVVVVAITGVINRGANKIFCWFERRLE